MLPACDSAEEEFCDLKCECDGCSYVGFDTCVNEREAEYREADFRGCPDLYDDWLDCEIATGVCQGADWRTSCGPEKDRLKNCTDKK